MGIEGLVGCLAVLLLLLFHSGVVEIKGNNWVAFFFSSQGPAYSDCPRTGVASKSYDIFPFFLCNAKEVEQIVVDGYSQK